MKITVKLEDLVGKTLKVKSFSDDENELIVAIDETGNAFVLKENFNAVEEQIKAHAFQLYRADPNLSL